LFENGPGDDVIRDAELLGFARTHVLRGKTVIERHLETGDLREPLQTIEPRKKTELHLGKAEHGLLVIGENAPVAGERDFESAAEGLPVHRGNDRFFRADEPGDGLVTGAAQRFAFA